MISNLIMESKSVAASLQEFCLCDNVLHQNKGTHLQRSDVKDDQYNP